jgi:hypothetical protein
VPVQLHPAATVPHEDVQHPAHTQTQLVIQTPDTKPCKALQSHRPLTGDAGHMGSMA